MIGDIVTVTVDRPLGSYHPEYRDMYYPVNYGYIEGIMAPDGEEQDAYILAWTHRYHSSRAESLRSCGGRTMSRRNGLSVRTA